MFHDLPHFPWTGLVLAAEIIFFTVFTGSLFWIFRKGSADFYARLANLPQEETRGSHE